MENKYSKTYTIQNKYGLHIRPSTALSKMARLYQSTIQIVYQDRTISAKSIMELLSLGVSKGEQITISAIGSDCQSAVEAIGYLINTRFGLQEDPDDPPLSETSKIVH